MGLKDEFATRNFSIYGQWLGILSMILCFALGLANIFTLFFGRILISVLSIFCIVSALIILFIEVPLLLRICPTSSSFDAAIRRVSTNYMRAGAYGVMALLQWLSLIAPPATSLIAAAVFLTLTAICYLLAAVKGQAFVGSKTLGGQGVAQMIV